MSVIELLANKAIGMANEAAARGGPLLYSPRGLRRFKAAVANSLNAPTYITAYGDSLFAGAGTAGSGGAIRYERDVRARDVATT